MRLIPALKAALLLGLALRLHRHGPPGDYAGLALAAAASWIGVAGPGEPVLIAAGILASRHKLDLGTVLLVAWAAAMLGGVAGWLIGMKAGRAVLSAPGPLHRARTRALARGDEVFARYPVWAILLTPSWIAGIQRARARVFLVTNALGAVIWAVGIGLGAYFAGPAVLDFVGDVGVVTTVALVVLIAVAIVAELRRRRRRNETRAAEAGHRPA